MVTPFTGAYMKFTLVLPIAKSRVEVWKAFDNPDNMKIW